MASQSGQDGIDYKYPTWDGSWDRWLDYHLRVELRADGMKQEELPFLGPRLASNLSARAFDAISDIDREKLRKEEGWKYLLEFLAKTRGKEKVDLLGDAFNEFFVKRDIYRKDGEEFVDYEPRFKMLIRKLEKALKEWGSQGQIPSELFGWYLLNCYMRMEPSDVANVRGRAESYKLDHVIAALQKMWSGGGLAAKDQESKMKKKNVASPALHVDEPYHDDGEVFQCAEDEEEEMLTLELSEAATMYQEALACFLNDPEDKDVLATFKEARKALDQAKTARGFYPTSNPNAPRYNSGMRKGYGTAGSSNPDANKDCMRCGKRGHIARNCPQKPSQRKGYGKGKVSFAQDAEGGETNCGFIGHFHSLEPGSIWQSTGATPFHVGFAVVDSGASDNVIGVDTLQDLANLYEEMGFNISDEFEINRTMHKTFIYGGDHSSQAIGLAHLTVGILGTEIVLDVHIVDGGTPLLLSAKFLYDAKAKIDFRTGEASFGNISDQKCILDRSPGNHLLLSITAFGGRVAQANLVPSSVQEEHEEDDALRSSEPNASETPKESTTVQSVQKGESRV